MVEEIPALCAERPEEEALAACAAYVRERIAGPLWKAIVEADESDVDKYTKLRDDLGVVRDLVRHRAPGDGTPPWFRAFEFSRSAPEGVAPAMENFATARRAERQKNSEDYKRIEKPHLGGYRRRRIVHGGGSRTPC